MWIVYLALLAAVFGSATPPPEHVPHIPDQHGAYVTVHQENRKKLKGDMAALLKHMKGYSDWIGAVGQQTAVKTNANIVQKVPTEDVALDSKAAAHRDALVKPIMQLDKEAEATSSKVASTQDDIDALGETQGHMVVAAAAIQKDQRVLRMKALEAGQSSFEANALAAKSKLEVNEFTKGAAFARDAAQEAKAARAAATEKMADAEAQQMKWQAREKSQRATHSSMTAEANDRKAQKMAHQKLHDGIRKKIETVMKEVVQARIDADMERAKARAAMLAEEEHRQKHAEAMRSMQQATVKIAKAELLEKEGSAMILKGQTIQKEAGKIISAQKTVQAKAKGDMKLHAHEAGVANAGKMAAQTKEAHHNQLERTQLLVHKNAVVDLTAERRSINHMAAEHVRFSLLAHKAWEAVEEAQRQVEDFGVKREEYEQARNSAEQDHASRVVVAENNEKRRTASQKSFAAATQDELRLLALSKSLQGKADSASAAAREKEVNIAQVSTSILTKQSALTSALHAVHETKNSINLKHRQSVSDFDRKVQVVERDAARDVQVALNRQRAEAHATIAKHREGEQKRILSRFL